jgi:hypothetical protein
MGRRTLSAAGNLDAGGRRGDVRHLVQGQPKEAGGLVIEKQLNKGWRLSNIVGWIALIVYGAHSVHLASVVISEGRNGAVLFLLWIIFAAILAVLIAHPFPTKPK